MRSGELIEFFSSFTKLQVGINEIADHIIASGIQDEIRFIGVELDVGILRGFLHRYTIRAKLYGDPIFRADIYYDRRQDLEWRRLVCCKELIHILDGPQHSTASREDAERLIERIVLPTEVHAQLEYTLAIDDKLGLAKALAVLFPAGARELLIPKYKCGDMTDEDIARIAQIPLRFVRFVMLDTWEKILDMLYHL